MGDLGKMGAKLRRRKAGLLVLLLVLPVLTYFAGTCTVGAVRDEQAAFSDIQRGHLRRLDGASAEGRVVFLGGSTFQGLDSSSVTPAGLNLSIGGDTLHALTQRAAGYRSLASARAVLIHIGLNDLVRDCVQPQARIEDLLVLVPAATPIILLGVQGVREADNGRRCGGGLAGLIDAFNQKLLRACNSRGNCQFVSNPVATTMDHNTMKALQEPDGVHLSAQGYQALSNALRTALSRVDASLAALP